MQEHVGKKRRKELRNALNMRKELNKYWGRIAAIIIVLLVVVFTLTILMAMGIIDAVSIINQILVMVIAFVGVMIISTQSTKAFDIRKKLKDYMAMHSITKEEIKEYKAQGGND